MVANKSGLLWSTLRNLAMAWVLTLPMVILLSGSLYWIFSRFFDTIASVLPIILVVFQVILVKTPLLGSFFNMGSFFLNDG